MSRGRPVSDRPVASPDRPTTTPDGLLRSGIARLMLGCTLLGLFALLVLWRLDVPLGVPGRFVYPYSPLAALRLGALAYLVVPAAATVLGIAWLGSATRAARTTGRGLLALGVCGTAVWALAAPPAALLQHFFNLRSPSQDGAFLLESQQMAHVGVATYLAEFPERVRLGPEALRGTRVLSNPPGATWLAWALTAGIDPDGARRARLGAWIAPQADPRDYAVVGATVLTIGAWTAMWLLAAVPLYGIGRLLAPATTAAAYAVLCVIAPATVLLVPGKDAAQLLTAAVVLWLWLLAWKRGQAFWALLAGAALAVGCCASLVHVWVAVAIVGATGFASRERGEWTRLGLMLAAAAAGFLAIAIGLRAGLRYDIVASSAAVARAQSIVTRGADAMPLAWQALGAPLFLLFAGPAVLLSILAGLAPLRGEPDARLGRGLLLCTLAILVATVGFTNVETPRLWIPFTPLILLAGLVYLLQHERNPQRRGLLAALLVGLQFAAVAASWPVMDMRGTEARITAEAGETPRFFE